MLMFTGSVGCGSGSNDLQWAAMDAISEADCRGSWPASNIGDHHQCIQDPNGVSSACMVSHHRNYACVDNIISVISLDYGVTGF